MKNKTNFLLAAITVAVLSACSTPAPVVAPAPAPEPVKPAPVAAAPAPVAAPVAVALPAYLDPNSSIYKNRSVYFDFDKYTVKPEFDALVADHGKFLAANPNVSIKVEGNTDERGGAEYNLALGQKRAQAVITALKVAGVKDTQMEAVSYGKEKPKATGTDDASRAQNRRADIVYPSK
jgi:peptidoglycan-associated lipoprotein